MALSSIDIIIRAQDAFSAVTKKAKDEISGLAKASELLKTSLSIGAIATTAATTLLALTKTAADYGSEISDASARTGIAASQLSGLKYAAEQSGTSFEGLTTGLKAFSKNIYDAAHGEKEGTDNLNALGLSARDSAGNVKSMNDLLLQAADIFSVLPDGAEKAALSMKLFGKAGTDLIPFLNEGRAGIKALTEEAAKLGLVIGDQTARDAKKFQDSLDAISKSAKGAAVSIGSILMPVFQGFLDISKLAAEDLLRTFKPFDERLRFLEDLVRKSRDAAKALQIDPEQMKKALEGLAPDIEVLVPGSELEKELFRQYQEMLATALEGAKTISRIVSQNRAELGRILGEEDPLVVSLRENAKRIDTVSDDYSKALEYFSDRLKNQIESIKYWQSQLEDFRIRTAKDEIGGIKEDVDVFEAATRRKVDITLEGLKKQKALIKEVRDAAGHVFDDMLSNSRSVFSSIAHLFEGLAQTIGRLLFQNLAQLAVFGRSGSGGLLGAIAPIIGATRTTGGLTGLTPPFIPGGRTGGLLGALGLGGLFGGGGAAAGATVSTIGGTTVLTGAGTGSALGLGVAGPGSFGGIAGAFGIGGPGLFGLGAATIPVLGGIAAGIFGLVKLFSHRTIEAPFTRDPYEQRSVEYFYNTVPEILDRMTGAIDRFTAKYEPVPAKSVIMSGVPAALRSSNQFKRDMNGVLQEDI